MTEPTAPTIVNAERLLLRALSTRFVEPAEWIAIERQLAGYCWREPDHAVIYTAITRARSRDPRRWREQLPAQTTRMGFPDLDWESFFRPSPAEPSLHQLMQVLVDRAE